MLGAVVNFFDTLGIGSFAPTTAWLKFRRLVPDRLIPPTMLVGLTPPAIAESDHFPAAARRAWSIRCCWSAASSRCCSAACSARRWSPRRRVWIVQLVVAIGLVLAAIAYTMTNLHLFPGGGTATCLPLALTIVAIVANFVFGVLLNFGVGNYAPTLVMLSLMGMDPRLCFPIMAAGAGADGRGAGIRHIQIGQIDLRVVLGLAIGGIPAVWSPPSSSKPCRSKCSLAGDRRGPLCRGDHASAPRMRGPPTSIESRRTRPTRCPARSEGS